MITPQPTPTPSGSFYEALGKQLQGQRLLQAVSKAQEVGLRAYPTDNGIEIRIPPDTSVFTSPSEPNFTDTSTQLYMITCGDYTPKRLELPASIRVEFVEDYTVAG